MQSRFVCVKCRQDRDVYKRQGVDGPTSVFVAGKLNSVLVSILLIAIGAVSYTHLDVYKRQGVNRMSELLSFFLSVLASVVAYYICKWLDGEE